MNLFVFLVGLNLVSSVKGSSVTGVCVCNGERRVQYTSKYSKAFLTNERVDIQLCVRERFQSGYFSCNIHSDYISLKRDCFCTYDQIALSRKPKGLCTDHSDDTKIITCNNCSSYSNKGPCLHGKLPKTCGDSLIATDIKCECEDGYTGSFCDHKMVTLLCHNRNVLDTHTPECNPSNLTSPCFTRSVQQSGLLFYCEEIDTNHIPYKNCSDMTEEDITTEKYQVPTVTTLTKQPGQPRTDTTSAAVWLPDSTSTMVFSSVCALLLNVWQRYLISDK